MKRKVVQVVPYTLKPRAIGFYKPPDFATVIAICDDGTLWVANNRNSWSQVKGPPGTIQPPKKRKQNP